MRVLTLRYTLGNLFFGVLVGLVAMTPATAVRALELAEGAPEVYEVRPGDTLWSIAGRYLRDPWLWPEIWQANDDQGNPDLIYPGERLRLVHVDGRPRVVRDTAAGASGEMRVVRLSPRVRVSALEAPVPMIPVASIAPFLTQPWVAESDAIKRAPYVVGFADDRTVAAPSDDVFVRRIDTTAVSEFEILRPGDALRDPDTNRILGYEATFVANAVLERVGDPAILRVMRSDREVAIGDRVIPASLEAPLENFFPRPAPAGMRGQILSVMNGISQIGQYDIVTINRGSHDRLQPGHVLEVFRGGEEVRDRVRDGGVNWNWKSDGPLTGAFWLGNEYSVKGWSESPTGSSAPIPLHADIGRDRATYIRPMQRAGLLMVFRSFDRVSFALVLNADRAMSVGDRVAPPPTR
ncbi:LysM peptidoglycan-binding domain-containing protein [Thiocapsa rosea]|uniref:LysM domain-containing protein n=1 Tax=Thiocapsa rosea TaxID=69360 RepID=A0A495V6Y0_9GAMM|nr:LysM domain-containing protein [Thiocapsa rosea]RKT45152.1 LysM domain-containing protein [Thiocapsa rosea]